MVVKCWGKEVFYNPVIKSQYFNEFESRGCDFISVSFFLILPIICMLNLVLYIMPILYCGYTLIFSYLTRFYIKIYIKFYHPRNQHFILYIIFVKALMILLYIHVKSGKPATTLCKETFCPLMKN